MAHTDHSEHDTSIEIVVACGTSVSHWSADELAQRPIQDFTLLQRMFPATVIDPPSVTRGRLGRLFDRVFGASWLIGFRSVRAAGDRRVIVAMADDVGIPVAAASAMLRSRAPVVMIAQHLRSRRARLLFGRLGLHRHVDVIFAMSTSIRTALVDEFGVEPGKIRMLYDTVDHRFFAMDDTAVRRQISSAGMAARDYRTLLHATRGLDADVKIEANSAWYSSPLNFGPDDVHECVELCNDGTTGGLRSIYASSQIVVVPLLDIGHAAGYTTIMEAMSMGKPVIASDIAMSSDFIVDGETGFLVPPGDVEALRERIVELLDDAAMRERIGTAARQSIEARYTRDHFAERLADAIEHVHPGVPA